MDRQGSEELEEMPPDDVPGRSGMETVLMIHHGALVCGRTREQAMERKAPEQVWT